MSDIIRPVIAAVRFYHRAYRFFDVRRIRIVFKSFSERNGVGGNDDTVFGFRFARSLSRLHVFCRKIYIR